MNTYNFYDENFINSKIFEEYMKINSSNGSLRLRATAASEAIPIEGVQITVYKIIDNNRVIFYQGQTNESGVTEKIPLPAPKLNKDIMDIPNKAVYKISAFYPKTNTNYEYEVNIYDNVCVLQNINIIPEILKEVGDFNGY